MTFLAEPANLMTSSKVRYFKGIKLIQIKLDHPTSQALEAVATAPSVTKFLRLETPITKDVNKSSWTA